MKLEVWLICTGITFTLLWLFTDKPTQVNCDNIAERCVLSSHNLPIDVVYTWVNGSNPIMLQQLLYYKNLMNDDLEHKTIQGSATEIKKEVDGVKEKKDVFTGRSILSIADHIAAPAPPKKKIQEAASLEDSPFVVTVECPIDGCIPAPVVVTSTSTTRDSITLKEIQAYNGFSDAVEVQYASPQNDIGVLMFIKFSSITTAQSAAAKVIMLGSSSMRFKPVYYSTQHGDGPYVRTTSLLIDVSNCEHNKLEKVKGILSYDVNQAMLCVGKDNVWNVRSICRHSSPKETYLVWPPWDKYSIGGLSSADVGSHRYADNEELRYSLRSLVMFAPWVRNIYIVTNGEIPHWLNINHPRIQVVPHKDIFQNKTHLPTFSSPAIETHIHNIPGLSENFIYFNDDILLGKPVMPEDFVSNNEYKIYLAWNIPNCNTGCPPNWLSDGYCDLACNVSACNFDGGDCSKPSNQLANNLLNIQQRTGNFMHSYCNTGCTATWVCDKYCDPACNVEKCGYDAGDCGVEDIKSKLFDIHLTKDLNNTEIPVPKGVIAFYLNTSDVNEVKSLKYEIDNDDVIRTAVMSKPHKIVSFTLLENKTDIIDVIIECGDDTKLKVKLVIDTNVSQLPYVKPKPVVESDEVKESWFIPEEKHAREMKHFDVVTREGLGDKEEENRLDKMVEDGLLTEEGKWYRLKMFVENNQNTVKETTLNKKEKFFEQGLVKSVEESKELNSLKLSDRLPHRELHSVEENLPQRKLQDAFASSLHHVNNLYTQNFGKEQRRVLAHMPFLVNRTIVNLLHQRFPSEYNNTSSNRFRSSNDMQFAFSYYYYIIHSKHNQTVPDFLNEVDLNQDGSYSEGELKVLTSRIFTQPIPFSVRLWFRQLLKNCSREQNITQFNPYNIILCPNITDLVNSTVPQISDYPHIIVDDKDVTFKMLKENYTKIMIDLDYIRKSPKKYICLNDNMDHKSPDHHMNQELLQEFYNTMFPIPSVFELEERNDFLYIEEFRAIRGQLYDVIMVVCFVTLLLIFCCCVKRRLVLRLIRQCLCSMFR